MRKIDIGLVRKIAEMAQLSISDDKINDFSEKLQSILEYFETLKSVDVEKLPPISLTTESFQPLAEDIVAGPGISLDDLLKIAPSIENNYFKVPLVIEPNEEE